MRTKELAVRCRCDAVGTRRASATNLVVQPLRPGKAILNLMGGCQAGEPRPCIDGVPGTRQAPAPNAEGIQRSTSRFAKGALLLEQELGVGWARVRVDG